MDNELEGFEIPVLLKGFILESDYEYYKNLVSKINLEQLKIDYDKFGTEAFSDLENGAGASVTQTCLHFNMVRSLQDKLKDSSNAHLTADQGTDYEIRFPSFKNMEDLLSRRDELFVSSKSDEEIKAFVQGYDKKLWYDQMQFDVRAKVVITGYDAENRPQVKFLSPELRSFNF